MHLTILSTTFNRAGLLYRLHQSIANLVASDLSFEWVIIDDGSTDDTQNVVKGFQSRSEFPIRYIIAPHGGKHRALNRGFAEARGDWILLIDSDDQFCNDAANLLRNALVKAEESEADGIIFPVTVPSAGPQFQFRLPDRLATFLDRFKGEPEFDSTIVLRRRSQMPLFPTFEGEYFLSETAYFLGALSASRFFLSNNVLVEVEYQPDGLSANITPQRMNAPRGACHVYGVIANSPVLRRQRLRAAANFARFWWHGLILKRQIIRLPKLWLIIFLPLGLPFAVRDLIDNRHETR